MDKPLIHSPSPNRTVGFSLVEVALSIGIIAFAFLALFALLPTGLTTFRSAIDMSNETWIMQDISSMVQTTDFKNIKDLNYETSEEIYFYDEEGKATDIERKGVTTATPAVKETRLYAVKLITQYMFRPDGTTTAPNGNPSEGKPSSSRWLSHGWRVIVVFDTVQDRAAKPLEFNSVKNEDTLRALPKETNVHSRTFFVARMDTDSDAIQ